MGSHHRTLHRGFAATGLILAAAWLFRDHWRVRGLADDTAEAIYGAWLLAAGGLLVAPFVGVLSVKGTGWRRAAEAALAVAGLTATPLVAGLALDRLVGGDGVLPLVISLLGAAAVAGLLGQAPTLARIDALRTVEALRASVARARPLDLLLPIFAAGIVGWMIADVIEQVREGVRWFGGGRLRRVSTVEWTLLLVWFALAPFTRRMVRAAPVIGRAHDPPHRGLRVALSEFAARLTPATLAAFLIGAAPALIAVGILLGQTVQLVVLTPLAVALVAGRHGRLGSTLALSVVWALALVVCVLLAYAGTLAVDRAAHHGAAAVRAAIDRPLVFDPRLHPEDVQRHRAPLQRLRHAPPDDIADHIVPVPDEDTPYYWSRARLRQAAGALTLPLALLLHVWLLCAVALAARGQHTVRGALRASRALLEWHDARFLTAAIGLMVLRLAVGALGDDRLFSRSVFDGWHIAAGVLRYVAYPAFVIAQAVWISRLMERLEPPVELGEVFD